MPLQEMFIDDIKFVEIDKLISTLNINKEIVDLDIYKKLVLTLNASNKKYISKNKLIDIVCSHPEEDSNCEKVHKQKLLIVEAFRNLQYKSLDDLLFKLS